MSQQTIFSIFTAILLVPLNIMRGMVHFVKRLSKNPSGFIGFLGLVAYFILAFIMPAIVEFDNEPKLDEITGPFGSRIQLAVHPDNADLRTFEDLAGKTVGVVSQTGGPMLIEPYADTLSIKTYRWNSRRTGGLVDNSLTALTNLILAIPRLPLLIVLAGLIHFDNTLFLGVLIGLLGWPILMRAIRAQVLSLRERDFVEAARSLGLSTNHIMLREILPNMISFVTINFIFSITFAMYEQVALVILGLAPINDYTWGIMIYFGRSRGTLYNPDGASMALSPILAIAFFQVCLVLFARALEEIFDPRLRTSVY